MDAVILAGGKNTRLEGMVAPYQKPLFVVNGESLIVRLVKQALEICERVIVVVSPQNCEQIMHLVKHHTKPTKERDIIFVLQPLDTEVNEALYVALLVAQEGAALLMCSDNYITDADWHKFTVAHLNSGGKSVCSVYVTAEFDEAKRFAQFEPRKISANMAFKDLEKWPEYRCWVGPVVIDASRTIYNLQSSGERLIANALAALGPQEVQRYFVPVYLNVRDIGTPEVAEELGTKI